MAGKTLILFASITALNIVLVRMVKDLNKNMAVKATSPERNKMFMSQLPHNDAFLLMMESVFSFFRLFGIRTCGGNVAFCWFIFVLSLHVAVELGCVWKVAKSVAGLTAFSTGNRSIVARFSGAIFYGNAVICLLVFWRLRSSWKRLTRDWSMAERTLGTGFPVDKSLKKKFVIVIATVTVFSVVEHSMSMYSIIVINLTNTTEIFRHYVTNSNAFLIIPSDYSTLLGLLLFTAGKTGTILWNFQDMMIILFSVGLASRYRRLNEYVKQIVSVDKIAATDFPQQQNADYIKINTWRKIREAYVRQAALVRKVDRELGGLILLSNANNFYFICLQIFNGIGGQDTGIVNRAYFFISTAWLCARACAVVLAAADINVQSRLALGCLYKCPDGKYNVEMERLEKQLNKDFVALSGMGFYYLNRTLLLEVSRYSITPLQGTSLLSEREYGLNHHKCSARSGEFKL